MSGPLDSQQNIVRFNAAGTALVNPVTGLDMSTLGTNTLTVGVGGRYSTIQAAIDSITDNLPVSYNVGTVSLTNGSAVITFSTAPAADMVVAGRDLFTVDGVRYYRLKNGPTIAGGVIFNLFEAYQGSTNAAATFSILKPNPKTILLLDSVYDFTGSAIARNILLKPYVGLVGLSADSCIIRRNKNNSTPDTNPMIGMAHGSWLSNVTLDSTDGHFMFYRMGLTAFSTVSQTEAMAGSRWRLDRCRLRNADPNGIDTGADYLGDNGHYYNGDVVYFDTCEFEHCWDGFSLSPLGGRLKYIFKGPLIVKIPIPLNKTASGACFIRMAQKLDVVMINPTYDQSTFCSDENFSTDAISNFIGYTGIAHITSTGGATLKVINPNVEMAIGVNSGRIAPFANIGGDAASSIAVYGGSITITGAGNAGAEVAGILQLAAGTITVSGTNIDSGKDGIKNNNAAGVINIQGGARIKGVNSSLTNTAGTVNRSANIATVGVTAGVITAAET